MLDYSVTNGVAVPRDLYTLGVFQGLQRAINSLSGYTRVAVDGQLGNATLGAARDLIADGNEAASDPIPPPPSVAALAERANLYAIEMAAWQDRKPDFRPQPTQRQREVLPTGNPDGDPYAPSSGAWSGKRIAMVTGLIVAGAWLGLRK